MSSRKLVDVNNEAELIEGFSSVEITSIDDVFPPSSELYQQLETVRNRVKRTSTFSKANLTIDECIAIHMFTMKTEENWMLQHFFQALDSKNRKEISQWFGFLRFLKNGLDKLDQKTVNLRQLIDDEHEWYQIKTAQENLYSKFGWYQVNSHATVSVDEHKKLFKVVGTDVSRIMNSTNTILIFWPTQVEAVNIDNLTANDNNHSTDDSLRQAHRSSIKEQFTQTNLTVLANRKSKAKIIFLSDSESSEHTTHASTSESIHETLVLSDTTKMNIVCCRRSQSSINKKHFVCPRRQCKNECNQQHKAGHCRGFKYVPHICKHHCSPTYRCFVCLKHPLDQPLHQCLRCHWLLCQRCAFIKI